MSRNGSGVYSKPAGTTAIPGETVASAPYNTLADDLVNDANAARPIGAGGTGATNAPTALDNLGGQPVDPDLTAIAALGYTSGAYLLKKTAAGTWALTALTAAAEALLDDADNAGLRTTLGVTATGADTAYNFRANNLSDVANAATARGNIGAAAAARLVSAGTGLSGGGDLSADRTLSLAVGAAATNLGYTPVNKAGDTMTGDLQINKATPGIDLLGTGSNVPNIQLRNAARYDDIRNTSSGLSFRSNTSGSPVEALLLPSGDFQIPQLPTSLATNSAGLRGAPINVQSTNYTFVISDSGCTVVHGSASPHNFTIPPNSSVPFPLGTVIVLQNTSGGGLLTILQGSGVTLIRADGVVGSGTRTVAATSIASIIKLNTNDWYMTGAFA